MLVDQTKEPRYAQVNKSENENKLEDRKNASRNEEQEQQEFTFSECSWNFFKIAAPTITSCLFLQLTYFVNTVFAGRLDDSAKLAAVGLGTTLINVACFDPLLGLNGALETLVA